MTEKFNEQSSAGSEMENLFKTNVADYTYRIINGAINGLNNEEKRFAGVFNTSAGQMRELVGTFSSDMTGDPEKDMETVEEDMTKDFESATHSRSIKRERKESKERNIFHSMKLISDFAKSESNGWIYVKGGDDNGQYATVEAEEVLGGIVKISAEAELDDICRSFYLSYNEEEDMSGASIDITNKDELKDALDKHLEIHAHLKEEIK